jgi:hypothetical protein
VLGKLTAFRGRPRGRDRFFALPTSRDFQNHDRRPPPQRPRRRGSSGCWKSLRCRTKSGTQAPETRLAPPELKAIHLVGKSPGSPTTARPYSSPARSFTSSSAAMPAAACSRTRRRPRTTTM